MDRLSSIVSDGHLWSDAEARSRGLSGPRIGLAHIKERRLRKLTLVSHPGLYVGQCVPFYFCPRSPMLYMHSRANDPNLPYRGGQEPIIHLEADLRRTVSWANATGRRWAFTSSNAGSFYFEDFSDLNLLEKVHWDAVQAHRWSGSGIEVAVRDRKQAEFLVEISFPWELVSRIGVHSPSTGNRALSQMRGSSHHPPVEIKPGWYYS